MLPLGTGTSSLTCRLAGSGPVSLTEAMEVSSCHGTHEQAGLRDKGPGHRAKGSPSPRVQPGGGTKGGSLSGSEASLSGSRSLF